MEESGRGGEMVVEAIKMLRTEDGLRSEMGEAGSSVTYIATPASTLFKSLILEWGTVDRFS